MPDPISCKEARKAGLLRYFTGKACPVGHVAERYCSDYSCVTCKLATEGKIRNQEKDTAACKRWRDANRERYKARRRAYYAKNASKIKAAVKAARDARKEEYKRRRDAKRAANPEYTKDICKRYCQRHPEKIRARAAFHRARRMNAPGSYSEQDIKLLRKKQKNKCAYCRCSLVNGYEIDHIYPISKGGSNDPSNLQLLCNSCNRHKSDKRPIEFAQSIGLLI